MSGQNQDKAPSWFAKYGFRLMRFGFAILLFATVVLPLVRGWNKFDWKDYSGLKVVTKTTTDYNSAPQNENSASRAIDEANKQNGSSPIRTESTVESPSPQMWVYGLQLAAWAGVLCIALWAIVALCRDE